MKQFQVMNPTTYVWRPVDEGEALSMMSTATDSLLLQWMPVGGRFTDADDFEFERLPDTAESTTNTQTDQLAREDRLERIATAVITGLCANSYDGHLNQPLSTASFADMANIAVEHARALIAKLDEAQ